jgi:hypothetical protein
MKLEISQPLRNKENLKTLKLDDLIYHIGNIEKNSNLFSMKAQGMK